MSLVILHPRIYANLLERVGNPHRSLKIRREIEKLRAKKRNEHRLQVNLTAEDASYLAGLIHASDLSRFDNAEEVRSYMEEIAKTGVSQEGMANNCYIGYSSSEWKAMIEIASGMESTLDLTKIPATVFYDMTQNYKWFEDYLGLMMARVKGIITQEQMNEMLSQQEAEDDDENVEPIWANGISPDTADEVITAFGAAPSEEEVDEDEHQAHGD